MLDIDQILGATPAPPLDTALSIGVSRSGRPLYGFRFGAGELKVSLIGGCHADEPVGPAMLDRLVAYLRGLPPDHDLLTSVSWWLVPHANPDGEAANRGWTDALGDPAGWTCRESPTAVDLARYLRAVRRERPGDDMEFGFPRGADDEGARPENRAIADFLAQAEELHLHGSFHGMGFAAGPWFLIERGWADRTVAMRESLRRIVVESGFRVHDIDRKGDKGFFRIDAGFTSRPDSKAMVQHFETRGDHETAALFRPSSMEWVRSLGGDPLTLVSEMPLFLLPAEAYESGDPIRPPMLGQLKAAFAEGDDVLRDTMTSLGVRPMTFRDQMAFQLAFLDEALKAVRMERTS